MNNETDNDDIARIEQAIQMLDTHVTDPSVEPFMTVLQELRKDPGNESLQAQLREAFNNLGIYQGAVLTYATSIYHLMVDDPFND